MDNDDFEGTLVLEKLASIAKLDAFLQAIDADDTHAATALMRQANIDSVTIRTVLKKMSEADGDH